MKKKWETSTPSSLSFKPFHSTHTKQKSHAKIAPAGVELNSVLSATEGIHSKIEVFASEDEEDEHDDFPHHLQNGGWNSVESQLEDGLEFINCSAQDIDSEGKYCSEGKLHLNPCSSTDEEEENEGSSYVEPEGFNSSKPEYKISILEKKLELYTKHLKASTSQIDKLKAKRLRSNQKVKELEEKLEEQHRHHEDERDQWEKERASSRTFKISGLNSSVNKTAKEIERQKKRQEAMRQMLSGVAEVEEDFDSSMLSPSNAVNITLKKIAKFFEKWYPLTRDVKQIEARYGHSVASYFKFFRWIFIIYLLVSIPSIVFAIFHFLNLSNIQSTSLSKFNGLVPEAFLYHSYQTTEAVSYAGLLCIIGSLFTLTTVQKWTQEDKKLKALEALENGKQHTYSHIAINAWDFYVTKTPEQVADMKKAIVEQINVAFHEDHQAETLQQRTKKEKYKLYGRRVLASILYLAMQLTGWFIIIKLTTQSSTLEEKLKTTYPALGQYASSIVPAGVTLINAILPAAISALTKFEKWDDAGFGIKAMVTRLFLAKILNFMIQLFSFALLFNPFLFSNQSVSSIRTSAEKVFQKSSSNTCRAAQVSTALFTLVLTEFVISKVLIVVMINVKKLLQRIKSKQETQKDEFLVAQKMVALLYFQTLLIMTIPLSPTLIVISAFFLYITFKFEKYILMNFQRKPLVPWNAKDAGNFFIKFYFTTIAIYLVGTHYFLQSQNLPKSCSLQDSAQKLCVSNSYSSSTLLCQINKNHTSAAYFNQMENNVLVNCVSGYPKCVCDGTLACGPFQSVQNGYSSLSTAIKQYTVLKELLELATDDVTGVWMFCFIVTLMLLFRQNSLNVSRFASSERETEFMTEITALQRKIRQQDKKMEAQKYVA